MEQSMKKSFLQNFLEENEFPVRSYCGRGMSIQCVGIDCGNAMQMLVEIFEALHDSDALQNDDANSIFRDMRLAEWDSMGKGEILYFPGVKWI